jgi:hypothetical protein
MNFLLKFTTSVTTDRIPRAGQTNPVNFAAEVQLQLMPDADGEQPSLCLIERRKYKAEDERVQSGGLRTEQGVSKGRPKISRKMA